MMEIAIEIVWIYQHFSHSAPGQTANCAQIANCAQTVNCAQTANCTQTAGTVKYRKSVDIVWDSSGKYW